MPTVKSVRTLAIILSVAAVGAVAPMAFARIIGGTSGNDTLNGTARADSIAGRGGDDRINGLAGDDAITGDAGDDTISGGPGEDIIYAGAGRDTVSGNGGDDHLFGGGGADVISGGAGNDSISVYKTNNRARITCGGGRDRVVAYRSDSVSSDCETVKFYKP
jgi:Ca2+-binding RTX toxin-like protein